MTAADDLQPPVIPDAEEVRREVTDAVTRVIRNATGTRIGRVTIARIAGNIASAVDAIRAELLEGATAWHQIGEVLDAEDPTDPASVMAALGRLPTAADGTLVTAPKPEIVTGEQAAQLPEQSHVIVCREDGTIPPDVTAARVGDPERNIWGGWYRVLYRAFERSILAGNVLTTAAELDACSVGTALHSAPVSGRRRFVEKLHDHEWYEAGVPTNMRAGDLLPADVLVVGGRS